MMDPDALAMERGEHLDLLLLMTMMNLLWGSFRFVSIHYYLAVELLPVVLDQVVAAAAVECIAVAEDCNCCFHSHRHISAAAAAVVVVVEDDIHHSTHLHRELTML